MRSEFEDDTAGNRRHINLPDGGPFILRSVLENIPLATEDHPHGVQISCVEYWNNNLYIGTTASEILHFVSLTAESADGEDGPTYILASRLQPGGWTNAPLNLQGQGVRRILLLPGPTKACVLCNGVVSFYSLPELSPAFPNREPSGVQWIGGLDGNEDLDNPEGQVVMIANSKRILLVRVGEKLKPIKNSIEYPGCLTSSRRDTIACVADRTSYALLEIEHQQKIPLFPISSSGEHAETPGRAPVISYLHKDSRPARPSSLVHRRLSPSPGPGHGRSTSLGDFINGASKRPPSSRLGSHERSGSRTPDPKPEAASPVVDVVPLRNHLHGTSLSKEPQARPRASTVVEPGPVIFDVVQPKTSEFLQPHILSPSPTEFLLSTGTDEDEPGVGLFVNLDGDVVRGTLEFSRYPEAVVMDKCLGMQSNDPSSADLSRDDCVLALMSRRVNDNLLTKGIEIQGVFSDSGSFSKLRGWLEVPWESLSNQTEVGLFRTTDACDQNFAEVGHLLRLVCLRVDGHGPETQHSLAGSSDPRTRASLETVEREKDLFEVHSVVSSAGWAATDRETRRVKEETTLACSLGFCQSQVMVWSGNRIWHVARNPLTLQLEAALGAAINEEAGFRVNASKITSVLGDIRKREAKNENEFISFNYIRQKSSLALFLDVRVRTHDDADYPENLRRTEDALVDGGLDPRIILMLIPMLRSEALHGPQGLWTHRGLAELFYHHYASISNVEVTAPVDFWMMLNRYLTMWQGKRGFGSITDEQYVFDSVDAGLLHVLLHLDQSLPPRSPAASSIRAKLHNVVDHWKGDFDRAVQLLEQYRRLFVLSRLYQSRRLAKAVLRTWKRIIDGEIDLGGELSASAAELKIRGYLVVIRDANLVEEYGLWLAARNPKVAIEVFTDDGSRVKFAPQRITALLKNKAPGAVQQYL